MKKYIVHTMNGRLGVVNFKDFVNQTPIYATREFCYETIFWRQTRPALFASTIYDSEIDGSYEKILVRLFRCRNFSAHHFFLQQLMSEAEVRSIPPSSDAVHMMSEEFVTSYGAPTHLVRIAPRTWMVTNPTDFTRVISSVDGEDPLRLLPLVGLVRLSVRKPIIYKFTRNKASE